MKHKVLTVCIAIFAFFLALGIMLYPPLSNAYNEKHQTEILTYYQEEVNEKDDSLLIAAKENADVYNSSLVPGVQLEKAFSDEALQQASEDYDNLLNITGNGIMGYIEIPSIEVYLPIYHGTSDSTLKTGIGHLLGSSLPVGGESTHTVLTGHSGMASQKMFTDLPQLEQGDVFYLYVLEDVLAYRVYDTAKVLPYETGKLVITEGKDLCTLITCTPIGVNTHRLLVMAERISFEAAEEITEEQTTEEKSGSYWEDNYIKGIVIGVCIVVVAVVIALIARLFARKSQRSGRTIVITLMVLLFTAGAATLCYPAVHGTYVDRQMKANAEAFIQRNETETDPAPLSPTEPSEQIVETEPQRPHTQLWDDMVIYNENLWNEKQVNLVDPWSYEQPSFKLGD